MKIPSYPKKIRTRIFLVYISDSEFEIDIANGIQTDLWILIHILYV
jgi:hypothetical protein